MAVLHSHTSKEPDIMHLLHCLFLFEARFSFHITASHIAGMENTLADDLSRNNILCIICFVGIQAQGLGEPSHSSSSTVRYGHQRQTGLDLSSLEADVQ